MTVRTTPQKNHTEANYTAKDTGKRSTPLAVFGSQGFRLLWIGELISLIGDQFYLIALPWLVLKLTGDPLAMSVVLALAGIPRAIFMLIGGAITDRFTPRLIMLASNLLRLVLVALLAGLVLTAKIEIWMLYGFALFFGLIDAFFFPAHNAIVPDLVENEQLPAANAILQGTAQLSLFAGPVLAGSLITILDQSGATEAAWSARGIGVAFALDALTFLVSAVTLWWIRSRKSEGKTKNEGNNGSLFSAIREGLVIVWNDISLRTFFILIAISNFLVNGPLIVGIPVLADTRLPEGAAAFGILMSAYGGGSLLGIILSGALPRPPARKMGVVLGVVWSGIGLAVAALGLVSTTFAGSVVTLFAGAANGYVATLFITWLQGRTQPHMLGRVMSLLMFSSVGLLPVSNLLTGSLINLNPVGLFLGSGSLMTLIVLLMLFNPAMHAMESGKVEIAAATD